MSRIRRHYLAVVAPVALAATVPLASCLDDPSGPGFQTGYLALAPSFESSAAGIVDVDSIHVVIVRLRDGETVIDTVVAHSADSDSVDLSFTVLVTSASEAFTLTLECLSPSGEVVFRAGPLGVTATTSGTGNVVAQNVPVAYVGVGWNAASVTILGAEHTVQFGDTLVLTAEVADSSETIIEGTPVKWVSLDTAKAKVPDPAVGRIVGNRVRGVVQIVAQLLTAPRDTVDVLVQPVPSAVVIVSGDGQTGVVETELANPIVVRVNAVDGPMEGVPVEFATAGDGYFGLSSVITGGSGQASTTWTLGSTVGTQTGTASVGSLVGTFTATATTPFEPSLSFVVQPSATAATATISPAVVVAALDGYGEPDTDFTGDISIAIGSNPSGGILSGTTTVAAYAGGASFSNLSINTEGTGYTLVASATGYVSATTAPFNISSALPRQVAWTNTSGGNWSDGANWNTGSPPSASDTAVIVTSGEYAVLLDADAAVDVLVLGDGLNQIGLSIVGQTLTVGDSLHVNEFAFLALAGNISGDGGIFVDGILSWTMGTIGASTPRPFHIGVPGQLALSGVDAKILDRRSLVNYGTIDWVQGNIVLLNNALISNEADADFGAYAQGSLSGSGMFQNVGFFIKDGPDSTIIQVPFSNIDSLDVSAGYLVLDNTFSHAMGALLYGIGTLDLTGATISLFEGDIGIGESPGLLIIQGDITLGSNSTLLVEIDGTTVNTEYDHLTIDGNINLAGTLDITMGYTPTIGDSYDILSSGTWTGRFDNIVGLDIGGGMVLDTIWNTGYLTLQAVSAGPQTVSWIDPAGGNWSDGANWSTGTAPAAGDTVIIDLDGTYTVVVDADAAVGLLTLGGATGTQTVSLGVQTVTANGPSVVSTNGVLDIGAGAFTGTGDLTNNGTIDLGGGSLDMPLDNQGYLLASAGSNSVTGAVTTGATSIIRVSGATHANGILTIASGFTNAGLIEISQGTDYTLYTNMLTVTAGTLINTGTIQATQGLRNGTRILDADVDNQGTIELVDHDLTIGGLRTLDTDAGTVTIPDGRTLTLNTGTTLILGTATTLSPTVSGRIVVNGDITLSSDFTLASGQPAFNMYNNNANVTTVSGSGSFTNADTVWIRQDTFEVPFTNQGVLLAYDVDAGSVFNGAFSNTASGVFRIPVRNTSGVTIANGFINAGLIDITQGNDYTLYTSTLTVTAGTLTNTGTIQATQGLRNGTRVLDANVDNQGTIATVDNGLVVTSAHTLTTDAGTIAVADGTTLTLNGGTTAILGIGTVLTPTSTGQVIVNGDLTLASDFTLPSGGPAFNMYNNNANVTTISGDFTFTNADTVLIREDVIQSAFVNQGMLLAYDANAGSSFNGAFSNLVGGTFRILVRNSSGVTIASGFDNAGLIDISQGNDYTLYTSTLTVSSGVLTNTGTIQSTQGLRNGTRVLAADVDNEGFVRAVDHPLTVNSPTGFTNSATGALEGASTINFGATTVTNLGATNPGTGGTTTGVLTIGNAFAFDDPASSLNIDLNGLTLGTEYDRLAVSGQLTLGGVLNVAVDAGFSPVEGNTFRVLTATSFTGGFSDMFFPGIGAGLDLDPVWSATALDLVVVAIPPGTDAIWEGASSTDWFDVANWSTGAVPTDVENVWIRRAPINQPIVGTSASVGSVVVQQGATVTVNGGAVLSVFGDLDAAGSIVGTGSVAMMTSGAAIAGTVNTLDIRNNVTLAGLVTVGSVDVNAGQLILGGNTMTVAFGFTTNGSGVLVMTDPADVLTARDGGFYGGATDTHLTAGTLNVSESFSQRTGISTNSFVASGTHRTVFNGTGQQQVTFGDYGATQSRFQNLEAEGSAAVRLPTFTGNGAYVAGDLIVRGTADVSPGCYQIDVAGNLTTSESGTITMTCADYASVVVNGDASFGGGSTDGRLTEGQLTIRGNLLQTGDAQSFAATGTHATVFVGPSPQTVTFYSPGVAQSHFSHFQVGGFVPGEFAEVFLASNAVAASDAFVQGDSGSTLILNGNTLDVADLFATTGSGTLVMTNALDVLNTANILFGGETTDGLLTAGTINVTGDFETRCVFESGSGSSNSFAASGSHTVVLNGGGTLQNLNTECNWSDSDGTHFQELQLANAASVLMIDHATVNGSVFVGGTADLDLGGRRIEILENLTTDGSGTVTMNTGGPSIYVYGNAVFGGGSTDGRLTVGNLDFYGDFTQTSGNSALSFAASGAHRAQFVGSVAQQVSFESPAETQSHFNSFYVAQTSTRPGITLASDVVTLDLLEATGDTLGELQKLSGAGRTLTVGGLDVDGLQLDAVLLKWTDVGAFTGNFTQFAVLRFLNHAATDTRMNVIHAGRATPYPFDDIFFGTESVDGYYLRAEDNDGILDFLTINLQFRSGSGTCWDPGNFMLEPGDYLEVNGAVINDVEFFCRFS